MPARNPDLHGNVPDKCCVALLLIDVINDFEFQEGERMLEPALAMAERIAALRVRTKEARIPTIYVNDNFGRWRSDFHMQVRHCLEDGVRGEPVVQKLLPAKDDYFLLKPKHSGFYSTSLDVLLHYLQAEILILAGIAGNSCVLYTANDAYMRDYHIIIPEDCVVSHSAEENRYALNQMRNSLKADTTRSEDLDLQRLLQGAAAVSR